MKFRQMPAFPAIDRPHDGLINCRQRRADVAQSGRGFRKRTKKFRKAYRPTDVLALRKRNAQTSVTGSVVAAAPVYRQDGNQIGSKLRSRGPTIDLANCIVKLAARFPRETVISSSLDHAADCTTQVGAQMRIAPLALLRRCCARRRLDASRFLGRPLPLPLTCRCEGMAISSGMNRLMAFPRYSSGMSAHGSPALKRATR
jgi:hypothetical protein